MSHKIEIKEGAVFIADAHYCKKYPAFFDFLKALEKGDIKSPQLILMGDMFELLFGGVKRTYLDHEREIGLLNKLSKTMEIVYFEGNHDFGLKMIFPDMKVFSLQEQPVNATFNQQDILLSHGDTRTPLAYQIYTKLIRNPLILFFVNLLNIVCFNCILKWLERRGTKKDPCYKIKDFEKIIKRRLGYLHGESLDVVIEGHFHQGKAFDLNDFLYINLASFACNHAYFIVQSSNKQFFLKEFYFKGPA